MTYDHLITLIKVEYGDDTDENGVEISNRIPTPVLCNKKSVSSSVFYSAKQEGLRPSYVFTINKYEYDGQQEIEYEGKCYRVMRTYEAGYEEIELTVGEVVGI